MILEIVNPSDACTIEGDDPAVLAAAALILGAGQYGLSGDFTMPPFLLGDPMAWFAEQFGEDFVAFLDAHEAAVAAALDTVTYGTAADRAELVAALAIMPAGARAGYKTAWMDRRRSSVNNIAARAAAMAEILRTKADETAKGTKQP
jgi:hypothetical protein